MLLANSCIIMILFFHFPAYTAASMKESSVNICTGEPEIFLCEASKQGSLSRLEWRIDFDNSHSVESVTQQYTSDDLEGHILRDSRPGVSFEFNLTSHNSSSLVSVMTVTANDTTLINNATVNCGDVAYPKKVHINEGIQLM